MQNPHYIRATPKLIAQIRKADLLICSGSDLEVGWLPILLQKANKNIQIGEIGNLMASDFVKTIEKPQILDRSMGDIHPDGNPHIHLNPHNILLVAKQLNSRLKKIDPNNAINYQIQYNKFIKKWQNSIKIWERKVSILKDVELVTHHKSFSYLINWLQAEEVANIETKPGISPSAIHLQKILKILKIKPARFIILSPHDLDNAGKWLSEKTDIKIIKLPYTIGGDSNSNNLFELFDQTINLLLQK